MRRQDARQDGKANDATRLRVHAAVFLWAAILLVAASLVTPRHGPGHDGQSPPAARLQNQKIATMNSTRETARP